MSTDWNLIELGDLGVLRFRGADAVRFLQGQVSNDVERLSAERSQLAGYHNPQGRAIALLRLVQLAPDDVLAILPRELIGTVAARLVKFVLRAKVKIADESAGWRVAGLVAPHSEGERAAAAGADTAAEIEARAISWATAQFQQASYESRLLAIPGLNLEVFWLSATKPGGVDLVVRTPTAPTKVGPQLFFPPGKALELQSFLAQIRPLASALLSMPAGYGA